MPRLIDADALKAEFAGRPPDWYSTGTILRSIDSAPTIDAVPVVRCRECRHWSEHPEGYLGVCSFISRNFVMENGYCAWGERKEDSNETDWLR